MKFRLDVDDGFPPISSELLHVEILDSHTAKIDNTPFFVEGIALGDLVLYEINDGSDLIEYISLKQVSGNRSFSIIFIEKAIENEVYLTLKNMSLYCEYGTFPEYDMIAVGIPRDFDLSVLRCYLDTMENDGLISYAELCINDPDR